MNDLYPELNIEMDDNDMLYWLTVETILTFVMGYPTCPFDELPKDYPESLKIDWYEVYFNDT